MDQDPMMMGPPPGAGPDPMMEADAQDAASKQGAMGAQAPAPTKPYTVKTITGLVEQFNETLDALGGADLPDLPWAPPEGQPKWEQPLPPGIYAPLYALKGAVSQVGGGQFASKYDLDCENMTDDTQVRKITGVLGRMAKDKKLAEAMQEPMAPPQAPPSAAPAPSEYTEDDKALM